MRTKADYLKWLKSDNQEIRNLAFQAAYLSGTISLSDLVNDYPELIDRNLIVVLKQHPEKWNDFINDVKQMEHPPVALMVQIVGMVTYCLVDKKLDFTPAIALVDAYKTQNDEANELVLSMFDCVLQDDFWLSIALNKVQKITAEIEEPLLERLNTSYRLEANQRIILDMIVETVDYGLKAKIVNFLLYRSDRHVSQALSLIEAHKVGLPAFMYYLIEYIKSTDSKEEVVEKILDILIADKILLPQNQRKQFFAALEHWLRKAYYADLVKLSESFSDRLAKLDQYLAVFPNDISKVFRLYNHLIVTDKYGSCSQNWFCGIRQTTFWDILVPKAFDAFYIKAILRHGSKEEQTDVYMLALNAEVCYYEAIRTKAKDILKLFEKTTYLTGSVMELLPQLEEILNKDKSLKPQVNWLLDLLLVQNSPLNHVSVMNLPEVDKFCMDFGLKAHNFHEKYKDFLVDMWEKQNEEETILAVLQKELAV